MKLRVQKADGTWLPVDCQVTESNGISATIQVPALRGEWIICSEGMQANIGGNDWRIYTLHPEDCAAIVGKSPISDQNYAKLGPRQLDELGDDE